MSALTPEEKVRIRHHLGYLNVQEAYTFVLGTPAGVETQFLIEGAMDRLLPTAVPLVRELVSKCDATEAQRFESQENLVAAQVGSITLRGREEQRDLAHSYDHWRNALANALGTTPNPYDLRPDHGLAGGLNVPVRG